MDATNELRRDLVRAILKSIHGAFDTTVDPSLTLKKAAIEDLSAQISANSVTKIQEVLNAFLESSQEITVGEVQKSLEKLLFRESVEDIEKATATSQPRNFSAQPVSFSTSRPELQKITSLAPRINNSGLFSKPSADLRSNSLFTGPPNTVNNNPLFGQPLVDLTKQSSSGQPPSSPLRFGKLTSGFPLLSG